MMPRDDPAYAAYLATTPAHDGGQPMTAPPDEPTGDPLVEEQLQAPAPRVGGGGGSRGGIDPWTTAQVALAQMQTRRRPRAPVVSAPAPLPRAGTLSAALGG